MTLKLKEIETRLRELADLDERSYDMNWTRRVQIIRESCDALAAERERIEALFCRCDEPTITTGLFRVCLVCSKRMEQP